MRCKRSENAGYIQRGKVTDTGVRGLKMGGAYSFLGWFLKLFFGVRGLKMKGAYSDCGEVERAGGCIRDVKMKGAYSQLLQDSCR